MRRNLASKKAHIDEVTVAGGDTMVRLKELIGELGN